MALADQIIRALGIEPEQLKLGVEAFNGFIADAKAMRGDMEAAKTGFGNAMAHFSGRLDVQDARLARIEALLITLASNTPEPAALSGPGPKVKRINGHDG